VRFARQADGTAGHFALTFEPMREIDPTGLEQSYSADTRRANRRRLGVFLGVFVVVALAGLVWDFSRPAEYRATARLQITPAVLTVAAGSADGGGGANGAQQFFTEVQTLSSRPLLEQVADGLRSAGHDLASLGLDPILALQSVLVVTAVENTQVVELVATGRAPELPAALLAGIVDVYRAHIAQTYRETTSEASARADEEAARLEAAVAAKREAMEAFRVSNNIVSPEREENSILAEMQGLAAAQKDAQKRLTEAEGKVEALRAAAAAGKGGVRARDNPGLVALEARASQIREQLRELGRNFTPDYLDIDPQARAQRARLAELEEQIKAQRTVGQQYALEEAEQELAAARESVRRTQQQIAAGRQQVGAFTARFSQYKSLRDELTQLERTYQEALQRQARLGATERARTPSVQVLEHAVIPKEPWRPLYWRDAGFVVGGSLLIALAAMWLVELFNRPTPRPSVLVTQPVFAGRLLPGQVLHELPEPAAHQRLAHDDRPRLAAPLSLPRELTPAEASALLRGSDVDAQRAMVLLLSGLSIEEALALRWRDVDGREAAVRVVGATPRTVPLAAGAITLLGERATDAEAFVLPGAGGAPLTMQELAGQLLVAAHDAGIERPQEVTPAALRHTYVAFLVRQGARLADVTRWVGTLDADLLSAYSQLAPRGERIETGAVQRFFPGLDASSSA
jgi:succinoglycan biosynthesis transport protein ExoP